MLLLIDVGNTTINIALTKDYVILNTFKVNTDLVKTTDEYYFTLRNLINFDEINDVFIASVVPQITQILQVLFRKFTKLVPLILETGIKTGVNVLTDNPKEVGADIIATAAAVISKTENTLIIDLGTATKYIYVEKNQIKGVIIYPGLKVSLNALVKSTALLPEIEVAVPKKVLGNNTIDAMQSGVTYGSAVQVDGLIELIRAEVKQDFKIVTTGGYSSVIISMVKNPNTNRRNLIFEGMLNIFKLNERRRQNDWEKKN